MTIREEDNTTNTAGPGGVLGASFSRVQVTVQVLLGSTKVTLAEMLALKSGSTITLEQKLGTPVSILVNNSNIAMGELFVLEGDNDRLGIKIIEMSTDSSTSSQN
jgi:flagellar motor switch protein FliN